MDIDECISAYTTLSDQIFQKQRHRVKINEQIQGRFDAAELERSVDEVAPLAIMAVGSACPLMTEPEYSLFGRRLLLHCERIVQRSQSDLQSVQGYEGSMDSLSRSFDKLGRLYQDQGKLKEAEEMYQRALKGKEKALGPEYMSTVKIARNLRRLHEESTQPKKRFAINLKRMRAVF